MIRLLKVLILLAALGFAGLTGYAYFGDIAPDEREVTVPVTLDG